eukprot:6210171-Pleurochrysis_carterae.AAC.2
MPGYGLSARVDMRAMLTWLAAFLALRQALCKRTTSEHLQYAQIAQSESCHRRHGRLAGRGVTGAAAARPALSRTGAEACAVALTPTQHFAAGRPRPNAPPLIPGIMVCQNVGSKFLKESVSGNAPSAVP